MDAAIKSLSEAMEKAYQNFLLRDLVGFVLPGAISLVSWSYLAGRPEQCPQQYIATVLETDWNAVQVLAFLAVSYLTAWILQSVHYGIIDSVSQKDLKSRLLWPFRGICIYMNAVGRCNEGTSAMDLCSPDSLVTRGALAPDRALKKIPELEIPPRVRDSYPYTERISALMSMTGNMVIGSLPILLIILCRVEFKSRWCNWIGFTIGLLILLLIYLEHWRLWYARNLRHRIFIEAAGRGKILVAK